MNWKKIKENIAGSGKPKKNVPLTREQIKALPVRKTHLEPTTNAHGNKLTFLKEVVDVSGFTPTGEFPTNMERRMDREKVKPNNRKTTRGRKTMTVVIRERQKTKVGTVLVNTGKMRKVALSNPNIKNQAFKKYDK